MNITNQKGTALLLALIIMSGLVVGAVTIGGVVINEIRQSRQLDRSIAAFYGAEAGAERLLFDWRDTHDADLFTNGCNEGGSKSLTGWDCSLNVDTLDQLTFNLSDLQVEEFPLYNPSDLRVDTGIESVVISWNDANPVVGGDEPWLEITLLGWPTGSQVDFANKEITKKAYKCSPAVAGGQVCETIYFDDLQANNMAYILRLKAMHDDISNVIIKFYSGDNGSGSLIDFSDYIRIADFTGSYRGIKQGVRVRFPVVEPSGSMFDYVLFSEEDVLKNIF